MDLSTSPLFERLKGARHVLIAGAGGGFDVFSGLPLYFRLRELGKTVSLASLSFTSLEMVEGRTLARRCLYLDVLKDTRTMLEVSQRIEDFRNRLTPVRPWKGIPV